MLVGLMFAGVTTFVLLDDVFRHGATITTKHIMTLAVLAGTIYFGHRFWAEVRQLRVGTTVGCAVLFLAGTAVCVIMSAGRNAEATITKAAVTNTANLDRSRVAIDRDEAKARYEAALKAETVECATGDGAKCQSKRILRKLRREDFDTAEATLRAQAPEQVPNADIRAAAAIFAKLPMVSAEVSVIEAMLHVFFPFVQSLFCEIAAIVGFSIALGHRKVKVIEAVADDGRQALPPPGKVSPLPLKAEEPATRCDETEAVFAALKKAGRPVTNTELAGIMGCSEGESSKRVSALNGQVRRVRVGREVAISL
jgi:hypothetical protein